MTRKSKSQPKSQKVSHYPEPEPGPKSQKIKVRVTELAPKSQKVVYRVTRPTPLPFMLDDLKKIKRTAESLGCAPQIETIMRNSKYARQYDAAQRENET